MQIFIFGDSITWGAWDVAGGGWVSRLRKDIDCIQVANQAFWYPIYNLGISGDTSAGLRARLERELVARRDPSEESLVVIAIGINDSIIQLTKEGHTITASDYQANLDYILSVAKKSAKEVWFVGLTPIQEQKLNPLPWDATKAYTTERVAEFDETLWNFCQETESRYLDVKAVFKGLQLEEVLSDGLHPNDLGHRLMADSVKESLSTSGLASKLYSRRMSPSSV